MFQTNPQVNLTFLKKNKNIVFLKLTLSTACIYWRTLLSSGNSDVFHDKQTNESFIINGWIEW